MKYLFIAAGCMFFASCANLKTGQEDYSRLNSELSSQLKVLAEASPADKVPRSYPDKNGDYYMVSYHDWTSGFPAGSYWLMYELTGDPYWMEAATENTLKLDGVQYLTNTHDLGFMVFCSYGNGYRMTGDETYKDVVIQASESLISRFNPTVGCIRSWDFGSWQFPVIIDNMMNLEMLFWVSKETGDPRFKDIAVSHADVTLAHHFRDDWSSFHVVSYDTLTGEPIVKQTHQGLNDDSAWGRGQAWGFYGYTMCYRETGDKKYLAAAENMGDFILEHLPEDMISYWDFNDPAIPNTNRDASAAAIMASAYYELSTFSDKGQTYLDAADKIMATLTSENYRVNDGSNGGFILKHSVGHKPVNSEVDVALNYADYYYLEALKRQKNLMK
jgi:unsaturated chondroitin disaccharide hydrolase